VVAATRSSTAWERYAWLAGIVFVLALLADFAVDRGTYRRRRRVWCLGGRDAEHDEKVILDGYS
jgi:hypothetical protein